MMTWRGRVCLSSFSSRRFFHSLFALLAIGGIIKNFAVSSMRQVFQITLGVFFKGPDAGTAAEVNPSPFVIHVEFLFDGMARHDGTNRVFFYLGPRGLGCDQQQGRNEKVKD